MFQLFFAASASAGAAAFLAFSSEMGAPYAFGIWATTLPTTLSANSSERKYRVVQFENMSAPSLQGDCAPTSLLSEIGVNKRFRERPRNSNCDLTQRGASTVPPFDAI